MRTRLYALACLLLRVASTFLICPAVVVALAPHTFISPLEIGPALIEFTADKYYVGLSVIADSDGKCRRDVKEGGSLSVSDEHLTYHFRFMGADISKSQYADTRYTGAKHWSLIIFRWECFSLLSFPACVSLILWIVRRIQRGSISASRFEVIPPEDRGGARRHVT